VPADLGERPSCEIRSPRGRPREDVGMTRSTCRNFCDAEAGQSRANALNRCRDIRCAEGSCSGPLAFTTSALPLIQNRSSKRKLRNVRFGRPPPFWLAIPSLLLTMELFGDGSSMCRLAPRAIVLPKEPLVALSRATVITARPASPGRNSLVRHDLIPFPFTTARWFAVQQNSA